MCIKMFHKRDLLLGGINKLLTDNRIIATNYLDIGCGNGDLTLLVAKILNANEVYGVDADDEILKKLPTSINKINFNLEMLNKSKLPFNQGYFDVITVIEVIEHLSNGDDLLKEVYRLLTPNGYLLITTPNLASLLNRFLLLLGYQPLYTEPSKYYYIGLRKVIKKSPISEYGHKNLYTIKALKNILEIYNFKVIATIGGQSTYDRFSFLPIAKFTSIAPNLIVLSKKK